MHVSLALIVGCLLAVSTGQHLLLAGGGLHRDSHFFWNRLVNLAGGKERAKIGIITAGKEKPEEAAESLTKILADYGALATWIGSSESGQDGANDPIVAAMVTKQQVIFIDDGDVHKLMKFLRNSDGSDSLVLAAVREKFRRGVVSGSGAGAAVLSGHPLPISGHSYECLVHGTKAHTDAPAAGGRRGQRRFNGCTYLAEGGLGFLQSWLIEPRFNDDTMHGRMIRMLLDARSDDQAPALGLGIDKEMALAIYRVGQIDEFAEVLGSKGGISIVNATGAHYESSPVLKISGVSMSFLSEDDKLILNTDEILPASWKADLSGEEWYILSNQSSDIFSAHQNAGRHPGSFNIQAKRLFNSAFSKKATHTSYQTSPKLTVEMDRRSAYAFHNDSPSTSQHCTSYVGLRVAISQHNGE